VIKVSVKMFFDHGARFDSGGRRQKLFKGTAYCKFDVKHLRLSLNFQKGGNRAAASLRDFLGTFTSTRDNSSSSISCSRLFPASGTPLPVSITSVPSSACSATSS
jgi:hypothetical protein